MLQVLQEASLVYGCQTLNIWVSFQYKKSTFICSGCASHLPPVIKIKESV